MTLPIARLCLPVALLLLLAPLGSQAQPPRADTTKFVLRPLEELNSSSDDYGATISPTRGWIILTSARDGNSALYRSQARGTVWSAPQRVVDSQLLDPRADNGALALALPRETQLGPLTGQELQKLIGGEGLLGLLVAGKRPEGETEADLAAVRVRDAAISSVVGLVAKATQIKDDSASSNDASINSAWWDSQAALAPDASFVVFTSDRPGGVGGSDLWIAERVQGGGYGPAHNLGSNVNSEEKDFAPFLAQDGRTLFFASTRSGGFGGSDIYRTERGTTGAWSAPENLGAALNTEANEAFFFGLGRERCIVASDRSGGAGGFDLYEGRPNIFAPGYTLLRVRMIDTTAGRGLGGSMEVFAEALGRPVASASVDPERGATVEVPANFSYRLELRTSLDSIRTVSTRVLPAGTASTVEVRFGTPPPPPPEVTLSIEGVNLPLYVSGYYRLNTQAALDTLRVRQGPDGDLRTSAYIASVRSDSAFSFYSERAVEVEREIDRFVTRALTGLFPIYRTVRKPGEHLEISVIGYADPRPISGTYREESVVFYDSTGAEVPVKRGTRLNNYLLAGLRATYAATELDARFRSAGGVGSEAYMQLVSEGAIRWRPLSGNVDVENNAEDLSQRRRIVVVLRRVEPE